MCICFFTCFNKSIIILKFSLLVSVEGLRFSWFRFWSTFCSISVCSQHVLKNCAILFAPWLSFSLVMSFETLNIWPYYEEALRPIRLLESRNQESGIVLKTFLNSCFASQTQETCFPPSKARSLEQWKWMTRNWTLGNERSEIRNQESGIRK